MTTIAVTEDEIAWDSQATAGWTRSQVPFEKVTVVGRKIIGCSGDVSSIERLPKWIAGGANPKKAPDGEWRCIVISATSCRIYSDDDLHGELSMLPAAIGSGQDFALGALFAGKSAQEAVEIAARLDVMTGGEIKSLPLNTVFKRRKPKSAA
jgi:hypothetical protein